MPRTRCVLHNGLSALRNDWQVSSRTTVTRLRAKQRYERSDLDAFLDDATVGHFGIADDNGHPVVFATAIIRDGYRILADVGRATNRREKRSRWEHARAPGQMGRQEARVWREEGTSGRRDPPEVSSHIGDARQDSTHQNIT